MNSVLALKGTRPRAQINNTVSLSLSLFDLFGAITIGRGNFTSPSVSGQKRKKGEENKRAVHLRAAI